MPAAKPTPASAPQKTPPAKRVPFKPDMHYWRQHGSCRLWQAVLLSLNASPSVKYRTFLKKSAPKLYQIYLRRLSILTTHYGRHEFLPTFDHPKAGEQLSEKFVELPNFLAFSKAFRWKVSPEFDAAMSEEMSELPGEKKVQVSKDLTPKGEAYNLVRMGALLKIIERVASQKPATFRTPNYINGNGEINHSALAKALSEIIAEEARKQGKVGVYGFSDESNRKHFAAACNALNSHFIPDKD